MPDSKPLTLNSPHVACLVIAHAAMRTPYADIAVVLRNRFGFETTKRKLLHWAHRPHVRDRVVAYRQLLVAHLTSTLEKVMLDEIRPEEAIEHAQVPTPAAPPVPKGVSDLTLPAGFGGRRISRVGREDPPPSLQDN